MGMFGPEGQIPEQDRFGWPHRLGNAVAPKREILLPNRTRCECPTTNLPESRNPSRA